MDKKVKKIANIDLQVMDMLFKQVQKPQNYIFTKVNNVYDNKYRINVYCEEEKDNLVKKRICASYFCSFLNNELHILG